MIKIKSEIKDLSFVDGDINEVEFEFFKKDEELGCIKFTLEAIPSFMVNLFPEYKRKIIKVETTKGKK